MISHDTWYWMVFGYLVLQFPVSIDGPFVLDSPEQRVLARQHIGTLDLHMNYRSAHRNS